jgi:2-polyprenyl-3-methyl-5-hydroxy-6-metoxy-1,4-benzoquinol methylase
VIHQLTDVSREAVEGQYRGAYHAAEDRHPGCIPYRKRYLHDRAIAQLRLERYRQTLGAQLNRGARALDVGAANGAWVDHLRKHHLKAFGIDPDPAMARDPEIVTGTIEQAERLFGMVRFELVTYHDVLEHLVEPAAELENARAQMRTGGALVVDVPDCATSAGDHHFKPEHLWFFTEQSLRDLFRAAGLRVLEVDRPVPGKLVVYGVAM